MDKNIISVSIDFVKLAEGEVDANIEVSRPDNVANDERYIEIDELVNRAAQILCNVLYDSMDMYLRRDNDED